MKKITTFKRMMAVAVLAVAGSLQGFAQMAYNNVWVKADVYPEGSGLVFVDWYLDEVNMAASSEFKRSANFSSDAFILVEPLNGYQFAGVARDYNKNYQYDNEVDKQIHIWASGYFSCLYDHTDYFVSGSSSASEALAKEALEQMTVPTDQLFAVFTKGAVARRAEGEETHGKVYSNKLYNEIGDQVTFSAYGDSESQSSGGVKYYKFDHWTDAGGNTVSTDREFTVTVTGMEVYYAHFSVTTKAEFKDTENDPNKIDWDSINNGINDVENTIVNDNRYYDLQGRSVAAPTKGIFINNGKKVVVK